MITQAVSDQLTAAVQAACLAGVTSGRVGLEQVRCSISDFGDLSVNATNEERWLNAQRDSMAGRWQGWVYLPERGTFVYDRDATDEDAMLLIGALNQLADLAAETVA